MKRAWSLLFLIIPFVGLVILGGQGCNSASPPPVSTRPAVVEIKNPKPKKIPQNFYLFPTEATSVTSSCYNPVKTEHDIVVPDQHIELIAPNSNEELPVGELVLLNVSNFSPPKYWKNTSYTWKILDITGGSATPYSFVHYRENNSGIAFSSGVTRRTLLIHVFVTHLYTAEKDKLYVYTRNNIISNLYVIDADVPNPPRPPNPPDPEPEPKEPTFPDGRFTLAKYVYDEVQKIKNEGDRRAGAKALSISFRGIAAAIAAGTIESPVDVLKRTKTSNNSSLEEAKVSVEAWEPFGTSLMSSLSALIQVGRLPTVQEYREAWLEIAIGLEEASKN